MKRIALSIASIVIVLQLASPGATARQAGDDRIAKEFQANARDYLTLRDSLINTGASARGAGDVARFEAALVKVRSARSNAKEGDVFTTPAQALFRKSLKPFSEQIKAHQVDDHDHELGESLHTWLHVNGSYPDEEPRSRVPPAVLQTLPSLPQDLQYRFVDRDLILLDVRVNMIVDVMRNAID